MGRCPSPSKARAAPSDISTAAWGVMIADGRAWIFQAWWISIFPGIGISTLIISLNLVGDWMRDTFDPRLRTR